MEPIDLDAMQREAKEEAPTVVFGGQTFVLPVEMPVGVTLLLAEAVKLPKKATVDVKLNALLGVVEELMGESYAAFIALHPSLEVIERLLDAVLPMYGFGSLGELPASESA